MNAHNDRGTLFMHQVRTCCVAGLLLMVTGFTSTSLGDNLTVDWRLCGYEDGIRGHAGEEIAAHRSECAVASVTPDFSAYQAGLREGLEQYCSPENGFSLGVRAATPRNSCPDEMKASFLVAYREGRESHERLSQALEPYGQVERSQMDRRGMKISPYQVEERRSPVR